MDNHTKISCICIAEKDIYALQKAISNFEEQSFANKELVITYPGSNEDFTKFANDHAQYNRIAYKEISLINSTEWVREIISETQSDITLLELSPLGYLNNTGQKEIALAETKGNFIATWSVLSFSTSDRLTQQMAFLHFMKKEANVITSITLYNHENSDAFITPYLEEGWADTLLIAKHLYKSIESKESQGFLKELIENNTLSIIDAPELYIAIADHSEEYIYKSQKLNADEAEALRKKIGAKKVYDGVLSLGAWCQVGAAMRNLGLSHINSPIHNFGVKTWNRLLDILDSRFENYWEWENMVQGKPEEGYSAQYNDARPVYKVYCNNYNMISNHHFDVCDNKPDEILTYDTFKEKIDVLTEIFLIQCEKYERVLFGCKILTAPGETVVHKEEILRLNSILTHLRKGKSFDLKLSVPAALHEEITGWIQEENLDHITTYPWTIEWNNDTQDEEWQWMLGDVKLADNNFIRLYQDIMGMEEISYEHIVYLNS